MKLIPIIEEQSSTNKFPRLNKDFIGIGHELESKRKNRRKIQMEEQAIENRVLHLQKEQAKAQKDLIQKRKQLQELIKVKERQEEDSRQKQRLKNEKLSELQRLKKHNEYMKMIHKHNLSNHLGHIKDRNHGDYSKVRQQRIDGQYRKKVNKQNDLRQKQDHWISLNIGKERGKIKIDQFYREKNKEHLQEYQSRIKKQDKKMERKLKMMKELEEKQSTLKDKLEKSTVKNSRIESIIEQFSQGLSPMNSRILETIETSTLRPKQSRKTVNSQRKSSTIRMRSGPAEEIQETIHEFNQQEKKQIFKVVKKRKKNKHSNRYKEYQAF